MADEVVLTKELITQLGAIGTVVLGIVTVWTGYRSKGKDQEQTAQNTLYSNLQADLKRISDDNASLRKEASEAHLAVNSCELSKIDMVRTHAAELTLAQNKRHDHKQIIREAFERMRAANIPYEDLVTRYDAVDKMTA